MLWLLSESEAVVDIVLVLYIDRLSLTTELSERQKVVDLSSTRVKGRTHKN